MTGIFFPCMHKSIVGEADIQIQSDMPDAMQAEIIEIAGQVSIKFDVDKQGSFAAESIKTELDKKFQPHWHVVIGNGFGAYVIHESQRFLYFKLRGRFYMIYKAGTGSIPN